MSSTETSEARGLRSAAATRAIRLDGDGRRPPDIPLTIGVYLALLAAIFPLLRVLQPGWWTLGAAVLPAVLLAAGFAARWMRLPAVAVSLIEAVLWTGTVTLVFFGGTALFGIIPVPGTFDAGVEYVELAMEEILTGAAPMPVARPLTFLIVAAVGVLTIAIDHVVLTARMPLLAAVGLIAVSLIPALAVASDVDAAAFILLAAALLFLLRAETRARDAAQAKAGPSGTAARPARTGGVAAAATGIGAVAVIVTLVVAPMFPAATAPASGGGGGRWNTIDPTLQLGKDLRRPAEGEVLRLTTDATSAPYLRAATLTAFDGKIWRPDIDRSERLDEEGTLGTVSVDEGVRLTRYTTEIEVVNLLSNWLPVPYPAVQVTGLEGEWGVLTDNRTVVSRSGSTDAQTYTTVADVPRPTLEQIRASKAHDTGVGATSVPDVLPDIVPQLAAETVAGADNDFDRLMALQSWFRGSSFQYSLEAPVEEDFDGTGVQALATFLEVREGYCIHFAGAFALMARTLGMSSRIVVGYLPGVPTTDDLTREKVYTVLSSQLHAWPEVYFDGIGWVPFEPTKSLGTPTTFSLASRSGLDTGGTDVEPAPSASPSPTATAGAGRDMPRDDSLAPSGSPTDLVKPLPWIVALLALLAALAVPGVIREAKRREMLSDARTGDAVAAWRSLQDTVVDLAIPEPPGESPRAFGRRLIAEHGAPEDATWVLIYAIERASFAPGRAKRLGGNLGDALTEVRSGMLSSVSRWRRFVALVFPRSLVVKPGSVFAVTGRVPLPSPGR